jgi:hypothetical protein
LIPDLLLDTSASSETSCDAPEIGDALSIGWEFVAHQTGSGYAVDEVPPESGSSALGPECKTDGGVSLVGARACQ